MRLWLTLIAILTIGLFTLQSVAGESCSTAKDTTSAKTVSVKGVSKGGSCGASCSSSCSAPCNDKAKTTAAKTVSVKGVSKGASCGTSCSSSCSAPCNDKAKTATAKTVSAEGGKTSCCGSCAGTCGGSAKTVAAKTVSAEGSKSSCSSTCGDKASEAKTVSAQTVSSKTVSVKGVSKGASCGASCSSSCSAPCNDKAKSVSAKVVSADAKSGTCQSACSNKLTAKAPKMTMLVSHGGKTILTTTSACSAKKAAEAKEGSTITYQVADAKYTCEKTAYTAYAKQLENYLGTMTKVAYVVDGKETCCPNTAKAMAKSNKSKVEYRVASVSFKNAELANAAAKHAKKAAEGVQMKYVVDGKEYHCSKSAGASCASAKEKMVYKVGENTTNSEPTAHATLMIERINAAAAVVAKTAEEGQASASAG